MKLQINRSDCSGADNAESRKPIRLEGLDLARYLAFVGMVIVNFKIAMEVEGGSTWLTAMTSALEGRAAATFVVLAGVGSGLASARGDFARTFTITLKRAAFLLVLGLINMTIFDADILHYYAFYFLFGVFLLPFGNRVLVGVVLALNVAFVGMVLTLEYDVGWNWETFSYSGFWTPTGFVRNLFFNGWHPVIPWLAFLVFGIVLSRLALAERTVQARMVGFGIGAVGLAEGISIVLMPALAAVDPELAPLATTEPVPPMPLYMLAGLGMASIVIGVCLRVAPWAAKVGLLGVVTPAGRQTLTLYIAHVLIGMGALDALGMLGGQSLGVSVGASVVFCALATVYAWLWARVFKRGPIEAAMRAIAG